MYVFNTLTVGDKTYTLSDQKGLKLPSEYGLKDGFYGGRVKWVGETETDVLLLIEQRDGKLRLLDTGAVDLKHISIEVLRKLCDQRSIPYDEKTTHKELQKLLK